jgi:hypothetical protein
MAKRPRVDWFRRDLDDRSATVSVESLMADYAMPHTHPRIVQTWIPLWLVSERLWEEVEGGHYPDWAHYAPDAIYPPLKVMLNVDPDHGLHVRLTLFVLDGNHRIRFWKHCGFTDAPAWVLDYRPSEGNLLLSGSNCV